ncbi:hypothetical protein SEVIR_4G148301v4 [Setaria viridis]
MLAHRGGSPFLSLPYLQDLPLVHAAPGKSDGELRAAAGRQEVGNGVRRGFTGRGGGDVVILIVFLEILGFQSCARKFVPKFCLQLSVPMFVVRFCSNIVTFLSDFVSNFCFRFITFGHNFCSYLLFTYFYS